MGGGRKRLKRQRATKKARAAQSGQKAWAVGSTPSGTKNTSILKAEYLRVIQASCFFVVQKIGRVGENLRGLNL